MKRLKKIADNNNLKSLIAKDCKDFSYDAVSAYSNKEYVGVEGGVDVQGEFIIDIDLNELAKASNTQFTEEEINNYINDLKSCKTPQQAENLCGLNMYWDDFDDAELMAVAKNSDYDKINVVSITNNNNVIEAKCDFTYDVDTDKYDKEMKERDQMFDDRY
jgi:1,4-alpha-glucan branching enzyme